jgi:hypothetical protein
MGDKEVLHSSFPMKVSVGNVTPPFLQSYNSKPRAVPVVCYGNVRIDSRSATGTVWLGRLVVLLAADASSAWPWR